MRTVLVLLVLVPFLGGCRRIPPGSRPWNLLVITVGSLTPGHVDELVEAEHPLLEGAASYTRAIAPHPDLGISLVSFWTGRYPAHHGVRAFEDPIDPEIPAWTQVLSADGIPTFARVAAQANGATPSLLSRFESFDRTPRERPWTDALTDELEELLVLREDKPEAPWLLWLHAPAEPELVGDWLLNVHERLVAHGQLANTVVTLAGMPRAGKNIAPGLAIRMPVVDAGPVARPVSLCDVGPTLLELVAGCKRSFGLTEFPTDGESLAPGLLDQDWQRAPVLVEGIGDGGLAVLAVEPERMLRVDRAGLVELTDAAGQPVEDPAAEDRMRAALVSAGMLQP